MILRVSGDARREKSPRLSRRAPAFQTVQRCPGRPNRRPEPHLQSREAPRGHAAHKSSFRPKPAEQLVFVVPITDTVECLNRREFIISRTHLFAQALDVAVDRAVININLVIIGDVHQLIADFTKPGRCANA